MPRKGHFEGQLGRSSFSSRSPGHWGRGVGVSGSAARIHIVIHGSPEKLDVFPPGIYDMG